MKKILYTFLIIAIIPLLTGCASVIKTEIFQPLQEQPKSVTPRNIILSSPPSNLRVSYNEMNKSVYLLWDELSDIKFYKGGYNIYRSLKEKELYMNINPTLIKEITFTDQNIFEGETYYYLITGVLPNGNESSYSNPIKITIPKGKEKFYDLDALNIDELTGNILPEAYAESEIVTTVNTPVIFNGTGKDRDGKIIKYEWDFDGNGTYDWSSSLDGKATYMYSEPKNYTAAFRVLDNKLASGIIDIKVTVYRCPKNMVEVEKKFCIDKYEYPNEYGAYPLVNVNWTTAVTLCEQQGKRLCSSEEWEMACRGTNHTIYPYGSEFSPHKCRSFMKWGKGPAPAGTYKECVSDYGVYDMSGNVWEWTDKPGAIYYGGFWDSGPEDTKCSSKFGLNPTLYYSDLGFRCCQD